MRIAGITNGNLDLRVPAWYNYEYKILISGQIEGELIESWGEQFDYGTEAIANHYVQYVG